ncbi:MAG: Tetratricopeptide repeat protein [Bacteroidetes bacterium ADurb.BinA245]|nr:MAG: Tetratricopeptide repeat protein [Bacteroidetes bacterium ADurb.BinA245]
MRNIKNIRQIAIFGSVIAGLFVIVSLFYYDFSSIPQSYNGRPYTLIERLLTEPRIIVFYISLILYPLSSRMTLLHDPAISHSLLDPWTTLPAIFFITALVIIALRFAAKKPLLSFCVIFFFLNHVVEGSFIPLELIYEHRNYIPSMFVFIPISIGILNIIRYFSYNRALKYIFVFSFSFLLAMMAHTVYYRNHIINTEIGLWLDNVEKSPRLSRVHNNIGQYFWNKGSLEKACISFSMAYNLNREMSRTQYGVIAYNLGNCFFNLKMDFEKAKALYEKAIELYPGDPSSYSGLGLVYLKKGDIANAKKYLLAAMKAEPEHPEYLHNLSLMYFLEKDYIQSIDFAKQALAFNKNDIPSLMLLAQSYYAKDDLQQSIKYWTSLDAILPKRLSTKLALLELSTITDDKRMQYIYLKLLKDISGQQSLTDILDAAEKENPTFPIYIPNRIILRKILAKEFSNH